MYFFMSRALKESYPRVVPLSALFCVQVSGEQQVDDEHFMWCSSCKVRGIACGSISVANK